ncbi:choice-of-anchor L domain-containing protein [Nannocystaceae bacterium ST9]
MVSAFVVALLGSGCAKDDHSSDIGLDEGIEDGIDSVGDGIETGEETSGNTTNNDSPLLDMGAGSDGEVPCGEGELCEGECEIPPHTPCDAAANTPLIQTMGLNCPGEMQVQVSTSGNPAAMGRRNSFGNAGAFPPREGSGYVALGSGLVAELDGAGGLFSTNCNSDIGNFDPGNLPAPLKGNDVGAQTCTDNQALVGTGDCSNTIEAQLAGTANDYTEIRFTVKVPDSVNSISYDLAFFSYEYPDYFQSVFNDMYIGWLESEVWTGNISFDAQGHPISLNAGFLDYKDSCAPNDPACGSGVAPELHGSCMEGHAGTTWLTSSAGVKPGEEITVVFAIFDMSDSILDSYVFLDNFQWGCDGDLPPQTVPIG